MIDHDEFVKGMVVTDVEFGPDGGLYVTDWDSSFAKGERGRIYRISADALNKDAKVLATKKILNDGMFNRSADELKGLLGHADMRVRQAAQFELADRGMQSFPTFADATRPASPKMARIHAIWGLGQLAQVAGGDRSAASAADGRRR